MRQDTAAAAATGSAEITASASRWGAEVSSSGPNIPPTLLDAAATPLPVARSAPRLRGRYGAARSAVTRGEGAGTAAFSSGSAATTPNRAITRAASSSRP